MAQQLPIQSVVNVTLSGVPVAAVTRSFGSLLIIGSSDVIDIGERIRQYSDITSVANDFGTEAPEYKAALLYLSQKPKPTILYIGRWAQANTAAVLRGGFRSTNEQSIADLNAISDGSLKITVNGVNKTVTGLDLSGVTNLNGVASALTTKLASATVIWNAPYSRFEIRTTATGDGTTIGYATAHTTGTDVSALLGLTQDLASVPVAGVNAETLTDTTAKFADISTKWYGMTVAAPIATPEDVLGVASFIEAAVPSRVFGHTLFNPQVIDPTITDDLASLLKAGKFGRTLTQFSSKSVYAVNSLLGRAFSVNFQGTNTTITLKFKQEPGIEPENIGTSQANTLTAKNCNVFAEFNNDTSIVLEGVMSDGTFIDERHGLDWLQNDLQTAIWNYNYARDTKISQTAGGMNSYCAVIEDRLEQAVRNGLVAPGVWNGDGFGTLKAGDYLAKGYYVFANSIDDQSQADREARKATLIQVAIKLAGAVHFVDVMVNFNR